MGLTGSTSDKMVTDVPIPRSPNQAAPETNELSLVAVTTNIGEQNNGTKTIERSDN